jgi:prevent-host-death family protein
MRYAVPASHSAFPCKACTVLYSQVMSSIDTLPRKGAEEARNGLPELLDDAEKGQSTVITRHGRPVAVLAPFATHRAAIGQQPLTPLQGSGRGLWGKDSTRTIRRLRDEWSR